MNRPSLYSIDIWSHWEMSIILVLTKALALLNENIDGKNEENQITDCLHKLLLYIKYEDNMISFGSVVRQTQNQPINALGIPENEASLRKKPDLQWVFNDVNALSPEKSQRYFTIECKCLSNDVDDKSYVSKGVSRYVLKEWEYSSSETSGAMLGYIKADTATNHFASVNTHNRTNGFPEMIAVVSGASTVYQYAQSFDAREFEPQKFTLHHLWTNVST